MGALKLYDVMVEGYGSDIIHATSPGKARASAWRCDAFNATSFKDFMRICRVKLRKEPAPDGGYEYVRQCYGVDPRIGQRVGLPWDRQGTVTYPGQTTAYVHVVIDGQDRVARFHPSDVTFPSPLPAAQGGR